MGSTLKVQNYIKYLQRFCRLLLAQIHHKHKTDSSETVCILYQYSKKKVQSSIFHPPLNLHLMLQNETIHIYLNEAPLSTPPAFISLMLQSLLIWIWRHSDVVLCRSCPALSALMGPCTYVETFLGLSQDV